MALKKSKEKKSIIKALTRDTQALKKQKLIAQSSPKSLYFFIIALFVLILSLAIYKGLVVAALVNGQPITRIALVRELEKQSASKTLDSLITKTLILQEIAKQKIVLSPSEVEEELKKIEQSLSTQGQQLDQILTSQGLTKKELADQIQLQKQIEKIISKDISVSETDVDEYIKKNEDSFPKEYNQEQIKEMVGEQLRQQKLDEKFQSWLEDLQKKAQIIRLVKF